MLKANTLRWLTATPLAVVVGAVLAHKLGSSVLVGTVLAAKALALAIAAGPLVVAARLHSNLHVRLRLESILFSAFLAVAVASFGAGGSLVFYQSLGFLAGIPLALASAWFGWTVHRHWYERGKVDLAQAALEA
jgi:hypothetical protein